ncbi:MAG: pyrrolo-quinoline quinone [Clostridia bacterium]|nr:pyrrolo-quinoline quinone [Clostridia bacterium]
MMAFDVRPEVNAETQPATAVVSSSGQMLSSDAHMAADIQLENAIGAASMAYGFQSAVMQDGAIIERYIRPQDVHFGSAEQYASVKGITTFAGNNYRNDFAYGTRTLTNKTLSRVWEQGVGSLQTAAGDTWEGTGWTGMPLIIQWEADVRKVLGVADSYKQMDGFTEAIYPATDGKIYFLELQTGAQTRAPIEVGVVMKSATLDPRGYPILYVGQGVEDEVDGKGAWVRAISLIENREIWRFGGRDPFAYRTYQAYDGGALLHGETDTLFLPGENGVFYSTKLHTDFSIETGSITIAPEPLVKYRYTADAYDETEAGRVWGIESSVAAFGQYGFFMDNGGFLQCIDLNTMCPAYVTDILAESDATPVIEPGEDTFYVYTATLAGKDDSIAYQRKHDGKTGEVLWENQCVTVDTGDPSDTRGTLGTPHVGHGNIENMVIFNCTMVPYSEEGQSKRGGSVMALSKQTGKVIWTYTQSGGCWSSPVVIYDEAENAYVIQCDRLGNMKLLDGRTGEELFSLDMGSRIESTPAVFNDMLVVGTRGKYGSGESAKIIGVKIG